MGKYPFLLILIKLCTGYFKNKLKGMNMKVDEDNGKTAVMVNGRYQNCCRFSSNEFWKNIGCIVSAPIFGLGKSRMWDN